MRLCYVFATTAEHKIVQGIIVTLLQISSKKYIVNALILKSLCIYKVQSVTKILRVHGSIMVFEVIIIMLKSYMPQVTSRLLY